MASLPPWTRPLGTALLAIALFFGGRATALELLPADQAHTTWFPGQLGLILAWLGVLSLRARSSAGARRLLGQSALVVALMLGVWAIAGYFVGNPFLRRQSGVWASIVSWSAGALYLGGTLLERVKGRRFATLTVLLVGLAFAAVTLQGGYNVTRVVMGDKVRAWNIYHYYLGAKYFPEVGFHDLYAATLVADDEWQEYKAGLTGKEARQARKQKDLGYIKKTRDMHTYQIISREQAVASYDRSQASRDRLWELGADVRDLRKVMGKKAFLSMMQDLGFNPGPAWMVVGRPLAEILSLKGTSLYLIANSDLPLWILIIGFSLWGFGARPTAAGLIFVMTIHFNEARHVGGFLQYDWLASSVIAVALYRRGWYASAGLVLSWGAMTRVFPGFLVFPMLGAMTWHLLRGGPEDPEPGDGRLRRRHASFMGAFVLACSLLFVGSHFTGRGLDTWPQWYEKIQMHTTYHPVTSNQRLGVGRMALHKPTARRFWNTERGGMLQRVAKSQGRKHGWQLLGLLLLLPALRKRSDTDAMVLMLFFGFLFTVSSRYYGSIWMLLPVLGLGIRAGPGRWLADDEQRGYAVLPVAMLMLATGVFFTSENHTTRYLIINYWAYAMFAAVCVGLITTDVLRWRRGRASITPQNTEPEFIEAAGDTP